jgi:hypothetical protein
LVQATYTAVLTVIPMSKIQKKSHTLRTESLWFIGRHLWREKDNP